MADNPAPAPENPEKPTTPPAGEPAKVLTAEEKMARLAAARAANAAKAAAKAAGLPPPAAPAPAAAAPATSAEPAKVLTAEEKMARLAAARAANAAKAAGLPPPAATATATTTAPAPTAAIAAAKTFPPKAAESKESGVEASGAPANKPAAAHLAAAAAKPATAAAKTKGAEVPLPPPPQLQTRRTFIEWSFAAWVFFFTFLGAVHALFLRFMFPNVLYEQDPRFVAGKRSDFPEVNNVYENYKQSQAVWIVRLLEEGNQDRLVALSTVCTHLGCTPNWLDAERKFKCPCHGSGYYLSGVNFEGPTPRPLERFRVYVDATGNVVIDKSKKYRKDLQQWNQPESFVTMG